MARPHPRFCVDLSPFPAFLNVSRANLDVDFGGTTAARMTTRAHISGMLLGRTTRALSPEREAKLELDQLRLAEENMRPAFFAMPAFALITCFLLAAWIPVNELAIWFLAMLASSVRFWVGGLFLELKTPLPATVRKWHLALTWLTLVSNLVWMFPLYGFYFRCSETGQMLLMMIAAGSMSAGMIMTTSSGRMIWAALVPYTIALSLPPLLVNDPFHVGIGVLGFGYSLFMGYVGFTVYVNARDLFLTREDKNELIEQLAAAKFESDRARQRAEAASQAKSEFLANMSHELRTPLNAIMGFSDLMKNQIFGPLGSHQYTEYAQHISDSGSHLLGLINDVLDLAKIEAGRLVIRPVELAVQESITHALKLFEVRARDKQVTLKLEADRDLPLLLADERGIHQVLLNLVSNAVKFTPAGGTVTVFARKKSNGCLDVGVIDTGVGIDPDDIQAVFAAFGQGRHDISNPEKGTGLGLPIVRGIVEAHGGKVSLQSELGKGTTITCHFPRERVSAPQPAQLRLTAMQNSR